MAAAASPLTSEVSFPLRKEKVHPDKAKTESSFVWENMLSLKK